MSSSPPRIITETLPNGVSFDMIFVEGSEFMMGAAEDDPDAFSSEKPVHSVLVSSFYMGKFLVTQDIWEAIVGHNPSHFKGQKRPVENISWDEIVDGFLPKLIAQTGRIYYLPSEAEWEFAARGGLCSEGYIYAGSDKLKEVGWYEDNSNKETKEVGGKYANELGLFDMSGNVWEWCADRWHDNYNSAPKDGSAWGGLSKKGGTRVIRGGGSFNIPRLCRCSCRINRWPRNRGNYLGFRLVLFPG